MRALVRAVVLLVGLATMAWTASAKGLTYDDLTDEEQDRLVSFVIGNSLFILYHESGHMLVSEYGIPVLGKEEDAVDKLATVMLLDQDDEAADQAVSDSADGWYWTSEQAGDTIEDSAFWDEHGLDLQRSYQIVCLMVGSNKEKFKEVADSYAMEEDKMDACNGDYVDTYNSWMKVLADHMLGEGDAPSNITVSYDDLKDSSLEMSHALIQGGELLELVADQLNTVYALEDGIVINATSCGEENAYWSSSDRKITFCYELVDFYIKMILDQIEKDRG